MTLGAALRLPAGTTVLDLACGSGEMLCTWARDLGYRGTGVDLSTVFVAAAQARAAELGVADAVRFVQGDAAGYVADEPVDVASCLGATWIGGGMEGTVGLLRRSVRPGGMVLVGEPYWRHTRRRAGRAVPRGTRQLTPTPRPPLAGAPRLGRVRADEPPPGGSVENDVVVINRAF
ncbi:SAM-dependent methyltransferase [Pseudonocardia sp. CA-107938]|uniref:SAM-dependent methyltransferase n=1 Tax=Pseudonocardia sp. CA-107938 TaxID=3240021 RepID=UPI003D8F7611